jgi:hypothetical protein
MYRKKYSLQVARLSIIIVVLTFPIISLSGTVQDFEISKSDNSYIVKNLNYSKIIFESNNASKSIQYALDKISSKGGSIIIRSGDYLLDIPLRLYDNITLSGRGRSTKLLVSKNNHEGIGIICKNSQLVEISNLTVSAGNNNNAKTGIIIDNSGNINVYNVFAIAFAEYGIWMRNHSFLSEISNCTLAGNKKANLYLDNLNWGTYGNFIPNLISNCTIYGGGKGIECNYVIVLNIVACNIYQTNDIGIHIYKQSNSVLVNACRTFQIGSDAILVEKSNELNVTGNIFCWSIGNGIVVRNAAWGNISGNNIIDNGSYNPGGKNFKSTFDDVEEKMPLKNGVSLHHVRGYTINSNTIFNWNLAPKMLYGIYEDSTSFKNIIEGNNINYFYRADVLSQGKETIVRDNVSLGDVTHSETGNFSNRISIVTIQES